jgi:hypothetical protein
MLMAPYPVTWLCYALQIYDNNYLANTAVATVMWNRPPAAFIIDQCNRRDNFCMLSLQYTKFQKLRNEKIGLIFS